LPTASTAPVRFPLGRQIVTAGINAWLQESSDAVFKDFVRAMGRHKMNDWGEVDAEDWATNDRAVRTGERLLSAYTVGDRKIWIITERDRSATTVLFPDEY